MFGHTTGQGVVSEGTRWWRSIESGKRSWGFTSANASFKLSNCDSSGTTDKSRAICWHTGGFAGYQCGDAKGNTKTHGIYEKVIFELF